MEIIHRNTDYGLRALLALTASEAPLSTRTLARQTGVPPHFLQKVLQALTRADLVAAQRGPGGGYRLAQSPAAVTLLSVMEALQGPVALNRCLLGRERCPQAPCGLTPTWEALQRRLTRFLSEITLARLHSELQAHTPTPKEGPDGGTTD